MKEQTLSQPELINARIARRVAENAAGAVVVTVQVPLAQPDNQPDRADIAKSWCTGAHAGKVWGRS